MQTLLSLLLEMKEFVTLREEISKGNACAVTGVGPIFKSHLIAGLRAHTDAPITILCQDDMSAKRLQEDLLAFLGQEVPVLCSRELTLYDSAVVSRGWEQKRLRQLYALTTGNTPLQIMTWDAMSQRTIPPQTLLSAVFHLQTGMQYDPDAHE